MGALPCLYFGLPFGTNAGSHLWMQQPSAGDLRFGHRRLGEGRGGRIAIALAVVSKAVVK